MESLNRLAIELVDEAIEFADELDIGIHELENEAIVLDFGIDAEGGLEAGLLLAEILTAGLATVGMRMGTVADTPRTTVEVTTDRAGLALLGSGKAGWELSVDGFEGLGSGPARSLVAMEREYEQLGYQDDFDFAVLAIESDTRPTTAVAERVAKRSGVEPSAVYLPTYSAGSITGSVIGAMRAAEMAVFRLSELGYDPTLITAAAGSAPLAPVAADEVTAIGRTTDAVVYGGRVHLHVESDFDRFEDVPANAPILHDRPLAIKFTSAEFKTSTPENDEGNGGDSHRQEEPLDSIVSTLEPAALGPAQLTVDVNGGRTVCHGERHDDRLVESFELPCD